MRSEQTNLKKTSGSRRKISRKGVSSRIVAGLIQFTEALESGEKITRHTITLNLEPGSYAPQKIKKTRKLLNLSQPLFAKFLGVAVQTVRAWEQGDNVPSDLACRFLDEINFNPSYWQERLRSAVVSVQS